MELGLLDSEELTMKRGRKFTWRGLLLIAGLCLSLGYLNAEFQNRKEQVWNKVFSLITGYKCEIVEDGRIKVTVPYQRKAKVEPENEEEGANIFYVTPRLWGPMPIEQETERRTRKYGKASESGKGLLWPEREEAILEVRGVMSEVRRLGSRGWEVRWEKSQGARGFVRQVVERKDGEVVVEDLMPPDTSKAER